MSQCVLTLLATAIAAQTEAINGLAAAISGSPSNIVSISATETADPAPAKPATKQAATPAKPTTKQAANAGQQSSLEKARAAKAAAAAEAKAAAEAAAAEAAEQAELVGGGEAESEVTIDQLRALGMQILKLKRQAPMKELLAELGTDSITNADKSIYQALFEGLTAIVEL